MKKNTAHKQFRTLVRLLSKAQSVLLDASYLVYKDQDHAERVCAGGLCANTVNHGQAKKFPCTILIEAKHLKGR